jgi:hypothetical protein
MFKERLIRARQWLTLALQALSVLIFIGAALDHTLVLPGPNIGLLEHLGIIILLVTVPILLFGSVRLLAAVEAVLSDPFEFTQSYLATAALVKHLSIKTNRRKQVLFTALAVVGLLSLIVNINSALQPDRAYGRDVFDSNRHPFGFATTRLYLAVIWCVVLPLAIVTVLIVCEALIALVRFAHQHGTLNVNWFAPDHCAGMARLGKLATRTAFLLLLVSSWPLANYYVFGHRRPLIVTTVALSIVSIGIPVWLLWHLHRAVLTARSIELAALSRRIDDALREKIWSVAADLVTIREGILTINTWGLPLRYAALALLMATIQAAVAVLSFVMPSIAASGGA